MKSKVKLIGQGVYSASKPLEHAERNDGEDWHAHSLRTWKEHFHVNHKGFVILPIFGIKNMLDSTAQFLGMKVKGEGKRTYGKIFQAGIILQAESPVLHMDGKPLKLVEVTDSLIEWVYCDSRGEKGGSNPKVMRAYPNVPNWSCEFELEAIDPRITQDVLLTHLVASGLYNGIGRYRPQKGGCHGRFQVMVDGKLCTKTVNTPTTEEEEVPAAKKSKKVQEAPEE